MAMLVLFLALHPKRPTEQFKDTKGDYVGWNAFDHGWSEAAQKARHSFVAPD